VHTGTSHHKGAHWNITGTSHHRNHNTVHTRTHLLLDAAMVQFLKGLGLVLQATRDTNVVREHKMLTKRASRRREKQHLFWIDFE
jgi:hypothetical protein